MGLGLLLLTFLGAKVPGRLGVTVLGALAGFGFGLVGIATRTLESPITVTGVLTDPSAYGIVVAGGVSLLALATALQRGGVTQATAAMVVAETVIPSGIGLAFLGDRIRPGYEVVAGIGLLVAIAGAVALSRLGEIPEDTAEAAVPDAPGVRRADPPRTRSALRPHQPRTGVSVGRDCAYCRSTEEAQSDQSFAHAPASGGG